MDNKKASDKQNYMQNLLLSAAPYCMQNSMRDLKRILHQREKYLETVEEGVIKRLHSAPEGALRVSSANNRIQYYYRKKPSDKNGVYIPGSNHQLVEKLAQKEYDEKVLKVLEKERKAIKAFFKNSPAHNLEELYDTLSVARRRVVIPVAETDDMFVKKWESAEYEKKGFSEESFELLTEKGERVRSKSEMIIANMLEKENIPYRYEYPIRLKGFGLVHPDFTVLNVRLRKEIYWEHLGMMDDPEYAEKAIRKIAAYHQSGFYSGDQLILTSETKLNPINVRQIKGIMEHFFL